MLLGKGLNSAQRWGWVERHIWRRDIWAWAGARKDTFILIACPTFHIKWPDLLGSSSKDDTDKGSSNGGFGVRTLTLWSFRQRWPICCFKVHSPGINRSRTICILSWGNSLSSISIENEAILCRTKHITRKKIERGINLREALILSPGIVEA